jgi:hypothetical protein
MGFGVLLAALPPGVPQFTYPPACLHLPGGRQAGKGRGRRSIDRREIDRGVGKNRDFNLVNALLELLGGIAPTQNIIYNNYLYCKVKDVVGGIGIRRLYFADP